MAVFPQGSQLPEGRVLELRAWVIRFTLLPWALISVAKKHLGPENLPAWTFYSPKKIT